MEIPGKVESNIKRRADSTRTTVSKEVSVVRSTIRDLVGLKPVQAIVGLVTDTIDNIGDWLKDQAKITREWIS
jgi:hypothetical protein